MSGTHHTGPSVVWLERLSQVEQKDWDALALPQKSPFLEWQWLHQLEATRCAAPDTGWQPRHLTLWRGRRLIAAAPLYIKTHSDGEFVFDHIWVDVSRRLGLPYYPKLVGMSPFTPVSTYRFLIDKEENESRLTTLMFDAIDQLCRRNNITGCHLLFVDPEWRHRVSTNAYSCWHHQSYNWINPGLRSFDQYLAMFNTNQRRNIKRERRAVAKAGLTLKALCGEKIPGRFPSLMYAFYRQTNEKFGPWGCRYLNEAFFESIYRRYRHRLLFVAAYRQDHEQGAEQNPVGMAFFVTKGKRLYGRYWGSAIPVKNLHFNVCYYTPIEWAIDRGIEIFDPGMGSHHKLRRGFASVPSYSLHRYYHPQMQWILRNNIDQINRMMQEEIVALNLAVPFSK